MDKAFDFSTAKKASQVPALIKLREAYQENLQAQKKPFDDDVLSWISKQDDNTRQRVNEMIRQVMGIGQTV